MAVTVLVVDDGGYGMLRYGRQEGGGQEGGGQHGGEAVPGTHLANPDFVKLAAAFGVEGVRVREVGTALEEALRQAVGTRQPRVVVCEVSLFPPKTTSPRWGE